MGLRDTLKRTFTKKPSDASDGKPPRRKDIEYYKPHEIPKSKYRGKVDKLHQAQLEAYSLEGAFASVRRRASNAFSGTFSPGGTGARSAATSLAPSAVNSRRPSYAHVRSHLSTANSVSEDRDSDSDNDNDSTRDQTTGIKSNSQDSSPSLIPDDTDTDSPVSTNGISRSMTAADSSRNDLTATMSLSLQKTVTAKPTRAKEPQYENHFTAEELEQAMAQASLRPRRGTVLGPVIVQPEGITA